MDELGNKRRGVTCHLTTSFKITVPHKTKSIEAETFLSLEVPQQKKIREIKSRKNCFLKCNYIFKTEKNNRTTEKNENWGKKGVAPFSIEFLSDII